MFRREQLLCHTVFDFAYFGLTTTYDIFFLKFVNDMDFFLQVRYTIYKICDLLLITNERKMRRKLKKSYTVNCSSSCSLCKVVVVVVAAIMMMRGEHFFVLFKWELLMTFPIFFPWQFLNYSQNHSNVSIVL